MNKFEDFYNKVAALAEAHLAALDFANGVLKELNELNAEMAFSPMEEWLESDKGEKWLDDSIIGSLP